MKSEVVSKNKKTKKNKNTNKIRLRDYWDATKVVLKSLRQYKKEAILSPNSTLTRPHTGRQVTETVD